ncbi:ATP-grasp domain-containing protein [Candidatus Woesearchaeota archaeon]|jgi:glutathione synthase|nr:ATP-grasp domain-containing protein [Candidatus Woesearchaeota archaeon]MBT7706819.1 ATP-grasp domain-containing protein [archaeon]
MKQMNLGAILRAPLPQLIAQENYFGDYDHLLFLKNVGHKLTVSRKGKHFEQIADKELVFFFDFPFNSQLAEELSSYEPHVKFVNQPSAVLKTSEKDFEFTHFNKYLPPTILIRNSSELELEDFIKTHKKVIAKPLDGTGGKDIFPFDLSDDSTENIARKVSELHTNHHSGYLLQEFIENKGDIRVICYNGKILGHFGRYNPNHHTNNLSNGGFVTRPELTNKDANTCEEVSSYLKDMGVYYAGIDLLESRLLEVNVACPGGVGVVTPRYGRSVHDAFRMFEQETYSLVKQI